MSDLSGKRALVTGASSGIGAAIARELAQRGCDLVLTARRQGELQRVADACKGVRVDIVAADLGKPDHTVFDAARAGGPVDVLINNAGFGYFRPFADVEWTRDVEMIQVNMTSLVQLARRFVDDRKDQPGWMLNVASIGAYQSVPNMALYAATKAFVRNFSEALHDEHRGTQMRVSCICPGGTRTPFHAAAGAGDYSWIANASMKDADQVARAGVRAMLANKRTVIPGAINKLSCFGVRLVPRRFASWMASRVLGKPKLALPARTTETSS